MNWLEEVEGLMGGHCSFVLLFWHLVCQQLFFPAISVPCLCRSPSLCLLELCIEREVSLVFGFFFVLFRAALVAYGGSQARSGIRAAAAAYAAATATWDLSMATLDP